MSLGINATGQVTITSSATLIIAVNAYRDSIVIYNSGTVTVFLGEVGVTAATGHALPAGASLTLTCSSPVYGIAASTSGAVTFLEEQ